MKFLIIIVHAFVVIFASVFRIEEDAVTAELRSRPLSCEFMF